MGPSPCRSREAQWPLLEQGDRRQTCQLAKAWARESSATCVWPRTNQESSGGIRKVPNGPWKPVRTPVLIHGIKAHFPFFSSLLLKVLSKTKTNLYMFFIGMLSNLTWPKGLGFNIFIIKNILTKMLITSPNNVLYKRFCRFLFHVGRQLIIYLLRNV